MTAGLCHAQQQVEKGELLNHQGQICADLDPGACNKRQHLQHPSNRESLIHGEDLEGFQEPDP